jgi:hypothetical protein
MRTLKRSECSVLHLGLKSHWYRLIESRQKCVEFREEKPYWNIRIANWIGRTVGGKTPILEFQNGYGRFSPRMWFVAGDGRFHLFTSLTASSPVTHKGLGEFPKDRFVLFIGERINLED